MLTKLPEWIGVRWNKFNADFKDKKKEFPACKVFVDSLERKLE